eukprot:1762113-Pyramimonas_sp.AAC.1
MANLRGGLPPSFWQLPPFVEFLAGACEVSASSGAAAAHFALVNDDSDKKHVQRIAYRAFPTEYISAHLPLQSTCASPLVTTFVKRWTKWSPRLGSEINALGWGAPRKKLTACPVAWATSIIRAL